MATIANMGACAHNPRGNLWFNDDTTYGHKLLMKMGWSKGKGLGKNEDGIKENLSVKFKSTNSGLGYKDDPYANIMKTEYESILKNLSSIYPQKETFTVEKNVKQEDKAHEQKSKVVKGKPRYSRLFYGKDVTKYSEKDMKSIFICSLPLTDNQETPEDSASLQNQVSEVESPREVKISTLSISDYFAKKMKEKKINPLSEETVSVASQQQAVLNTENIVKKEKINSEEEISESNQQPALDSKIIIKKEKINSDETISELSQQQAVLDAEIIVKKEKRNSEINNNKESVNYSNDQDTTIIGTEYDFVSSKKRSSSKKKKKSEIITDGIESVDTCDLETESMSPKKKKQKLSEDVVCENNLEIEISEVDKTSNYISSDKKRKKARMCENESSSVETFANDASEDKISSDIELSRKKRKKSKMCEDKNGSFETLTNDACNGKISCQIELSSDKALQLKKKHKKHNKEGSIHTEANEVSLTNSTTSDQHPSNIEGDNAIVPSKKKKKSKKKKFKKLKSCLRSRTGMYSIKNVSFNESVSYRVIDDNYESFESLSDECSITREVLTNGESHSTDSFESESGNDTSDIQVMNYDNHKGNGLDIGTEQKVLDVDCKESHSMPDSSVSEHQEKALDTDVKDNCSLSSLPSPESSNYNCWVESQRQALKMKMYKNMLKNIKKHEVLKSSNLLSIKGYGNWGFK